MFIIFGILIIIAFWIAYEKGRSTKTAKKQSEAFWEREAKADLTRKKDISGLPYILIPFDLLPFQDSKNPEITDVQDRLQNLKDKKMINLTGYTNTDLKLQYGMQNLNQLSEYDHNFTLLTRYLYKWASLLIEQGDTASAKAVLEYGIECGTDIKGNYTLLAKMYAEEQDYPAIQELIQKAESIRTIMKDAAIEELRGILNS